MSEYIPLKHPIKARIVRAPEDVVLLQLIMDEVGTAKMEAEMRACARIFRDNPPSSGLVTTAVRIGYLGDFPGDEEE